MTIRNKTANIYTEWMPLVNGLSDEDAGKIFKAILKYQNGEDVDNKNPVWVFIKSKLDEYNKKGENISLSRSEAGKKGMANRWKNKEKITNITNDNNYYQMITNDNKNNNKIKENKIKYKYNIYKYTGKIIKLNEKDYNDWKNKFPEVDLDYCLNSMDIYLQQHPDKQKNWFWMTQQSLNKKNHELLEEKKKQPDIVNKRISDMTEYDMAVMTASLR